MTKLIRRLLGLLFTLGIYTKHYKVVYDGDITSANVVWSGGHWSQRSATKQKFEKIFTILLLEARITKPLTEFSLVVFYNTKHDCDNLSTIQKIFVDAMKGTYVADDTSKFYKSTHTIFDSVLPKGTVEIHIIGK